MSGRRVALLGGRGMLGTDLAAALEAAGLSPWVLDRPEFDITSIDQVREVVAGADVVVNCAAYTNVDGAESEPVTAYLVNAEAVGRLGAVARQHDVPVLHISTDFVFDGGGVEPYREEDPIGPLGVYGASKLLGERLLAASGCHGCVVRVQWTYGRGGDNFIEKILRRARAGEPLQVVDDQVGAPTSTRDVSDVLCDLLRRDVLPEGLYHCAAAGYASRYQVARFVLDTVGIDVPVRPCHSSDFVCPARRPLNSRFNCEKIEACLGRPMPPWQRSLASYLEQKP